MAHLCTSFAWPQALEYEVEGLRPATNSCHADAAPLTSDHCSYAKGTKCFAPRAHKANGQRHTLCAYHRERSCINQRAVDQRKRHQKGQWQSTVVPVRDQRLFLDFVATLWATPPPPTHTAPF
ncbi:hypothetical protein SDRG_11428 [Saprolegnia diclina VS20]|uniref:Uncharacterized protein n=1 Tax=Saprolegnia diclina (strain VS20) TaxID=1156394 RepID=T0QBR9_SAPDV|nr:hypothetical protein SDRG_11428 [Saprolegnia diclina VS20]EQC30955.1 hypothetical protein SDRG_11428 [Saprolegnia diclina VS20]|eukprot:XP_008615693.1 hypothetical protein SDRG_11428 [Saprolegnia diclina VS20]